MSITRFQHLDAKALSMRAQVVALAFFRIFNLIDILVTDQFALYWYDAIIKV